MNEPSLAASLVTCAPAPQWADFPSPQVEHTASRERSQAGRCAWLSDCQISLTDDETVVLSRTVYEVTSVDGLQAVANLHFDFDPGFERFAFHHVRVTRGGITRDADPLASLELLRRERNLERAVFDGRLTASISLPDIQVGDVVDICHSRTGAHPMLAGHFCAEFVLNWQCWVGETRLRLISPPDRRLVVRSWNGAPDAEIRHTACGDLVRTWRTAQTEPVTLERFMPGWVRPFTSVQVCDEMSWPEVAAIFADSYQPQPLPQDLESAVAALKAETCEMPQRIVKALRLVQGGLRYQAVNIGDGGFVPRDIDKIWASRTGDCKDASRLLATVLQALGVDASPALVNTRVGPRLNEEPAHPNAFNHCVVGLKLDGARYWVDPTLYPQGGTLDTLCQSRFGWALPLRAGADLERMGQDILADSFDVLEVYKLPVDIDEPGTLTVKTTYFGWRADYVRRALANGLEAFSRERLERRARRFDSANEIEPVRMSDDLEANKLELVEKVSLGRVWRPLSDGRVAFEAPDDFFSGNIPAVTSEGRRWPIWLGPPCRATSVIEIHSPLPAPPKIWDEDLQAPGVRVTSRLAAIDADQKVIRLRRGLTLDHMVIEASDAVALAELWEGIRLKSAVVVRQLVHNGKIYTPRTKRGWAARLGLVAFIMLAVGLLINLIASLTSLSSLK